MLVGGRSRDSGLGPSDLRVEGYLFKVCFVGTGPLLAVEFPHAPGWVWRVSFLGLGAVREA